MTKSAKPEQGSSLGTLYLVATPIGNFEDMSYRAVRLLTEADAVYCEDTRRTLVLLRHFHIDRPAGIDSFHDHSPRGVLAKIKSQLEEGKSVVYVTDGGMPVVSDPGYVLVRAAHELGAPVSVVPGPSAAATLFAASGLGSPKYLFHGFFPRTRGEVERTLEVIRGNPIVHIFYEAPNRLGGSLEILARQLPEAEVVVGRELTKMHEELVRGTAAEVYENFGAREKIRGECAIAILGGQPRPTQSVTASSACPENPSGEQKSVELTAEQQAEVASLIKSGVSSKDAAKELSKKFGLSRRVIYEFIIRRLT